MRTQAMNMFTSSHQDCRTSCVSLSLPTPSLWASEKDTKPSPTPFHPPAQVDKKAALTVLSS